MKLKYVYSFLVAVSIMLLISSSVYADALSFNGTNIGYDNAIVEQGYAPGSSTIHQWRAAHFEYSTFPDQIMTDLGATVWTTYVKCLPSNTLYSYSRLESINNPWMIQNYTRSYHSYNGTWILKTDVACPNGSTLTRYNYVNHYWQAYGNVVGSAEKLQTSTLRWTTFADVPTNHWAYSFIEPVAQTGIMDIVAIRHNCISPLFCPNSAVTRGEMAYFLERGIRGSDELIPQGTGYVFSDVPQSYENQSGWSGFPNSNVVGFIEKLYSDGITGGCQSYPLSYCPNGTVTRAQMAVFLLRAEHGSWYTPPAVGSTSFSDVPANYWAAAWIEQLYNEGITGGCATSPLRYCPEQPITRAEMAVFLFRTFMP